MAKPGFSPRYPSLPLISMILKLLAYLKLAFGIVIILYSMLIVMKSAGFGTAFSAMVPQIFELIIGFVAMLAASELIHVFLDIESNTRRTAEAAQGYDLRSTPRNDSAGL